MVEDKRKDVVISRRGFVLGAAATCVALTGGFTVVSVLGKPIAIEKNLFLDFPLDEGLKESLFYASLAPSSHNSQMWKVEISPNEGLLRIKINSSRELSQVDPSNREAFISIGAFLRNLEIALNVYNYNAKVGVFDELGEDGLIAQVSYEKKEIKEIDAAVLNLIERRHTDKSSYTDSLLPEETVVSLSNLSDSLHYFSKESKYGDYLAQATLGAMKLQVSDQSKRDELAQWLRFSDVETFEKKDGLPAEQLGITGVKKTLYYLFMNKDSARDDSYAQQGVDLCKGQVENLSGFFVITGKHDLGSLVQVGITLQDFWLKATSLGVSVHPMSQILEEEPYSSEVKTQLELDEQPQMILRVGSVPEYGRNAGIRRGLSEFVFQK